MRQIFCEKLKKHAEALSKQPIPGQLGEKIYQSISKLAWESWLKHQTILINEYKLSLIDPKARSFLLSEMEKFFFGEGSEKPPQFKTK